MMATEAQGWRAMPRDPTRAKLAHGMVVDPQANGTYVVWSGDSAQPLTRMHYAVQLDDVSMPVCDCGDHIYRDLLCKHALAALDYEWTRDREPGT